MEKTIVLSINSIIYTIDQKEAIQSGIITDMMNEDDNNVININISLKCKKQVMDKIYEFLKYHANNPSLKINLPLKNLNIEDYVTTWDNQWIHSFENMNEISEAIYIADFLDIPVIIDMLLCYIAIGIKTSL
jgi:S-phase kinase-associated protein 1